MSSQQSLLMGLLTETSLHAGVGQNIDVIDLPIQCEAHTGYPCVFGSAVKGALRTLAEDKKTPHTIELFGANDGNEHAGALIITDARLLLLPVRSLTSHFKWVTCPAILKRLKADCERLGLTQEFTVPDVKEKALVYQKDSDNLFLEEFRFEIEQKEKELTTIIEVIFQFMGRDDAQEILKKQLIIINDDMFSQIVKSATPVNAHIAIDNETKTVIGGALWYEETLPPDTLLYVGVVANKTRKNKETKTTDGTEKNCHLKSADGVKECFEELFEKYPYLQLGGNETVGMGWCKVKFLKK